MKLTFNNEAITMIPCKSLSYGDCFMPDPMDDEVYMRVQDFWQPTTTHITAINLRDMSGKKFPVEQMVKQVQSEITIFLK